MGLIEIEPEIKQWELDGPMPPTQMFRLVFMGVVPISIGVGAVSNFGILSLDSLSLAGLPCLGSVVSVLL